MTTKRFTGQYHEAGLPGGEGLSYYNARWYDAKLGRFISADVIVPKPGNPQAFNRYSYVLNNPLRYTDPTGHIFESFATMQREGGSAPSYRPVLSTYQLDLVKQYSTTYQVPWQVVGGVLEAEIRLDTQPRDRYENWAVRLFPLITYAPPLMHTFAPGVAQRLGIPQDVGPGIGNIHISTAVRVSAYYATYYPNHRTWQLNFHRVPQMMTANVLTFDEESIETVAAIARQLADDRFGSNEQPNLTDHSDLSKWTITDAVAVWHGYRYGVPGVSPMGSGFQRATVFQDRRASILYSHIFVGPGDPVASARGSIPSFLYYFPQE